MQGWEEPHPCHPLWEKGGMGGATGHEGLHGQPHGLGTSAPSQG